MIERLLPLGAAMLVGGTVATKMRGIRRLRDARTDKMASSPFVPRPFVEAGFQLARVMAHGAMRVGITANVCTALSVVLSVAAAVLVARGELIFGGWMLLLGSSLDTLDGIIARETGTASDAGELLDATADRVNDAAAFLGLLYYYREDSLAFVLVCIALVGSLLVSYVRAKGEAMSVDCAVGWMQRHERIIWLCLGLLIGPLAARWIEPDAVTPRCHVLLGALTVIGFFSFVTAVQRTRLVYRALVVRRDSTRDARRA